MQKGNILFLILLAVILFAALAYAVTSSIRGGGKSAETESATLKAAQILQVYQGLEAAIQRLMLVNDCKDTQISFENPVVTGYDNPNAPAGVLDKCHVFNAAGGGLIFPVFDKSVYDPATDIYAWYATAYLSGRSSVAHIGKDNSDAASSELHFVLPGVAPAICRAYNKLLNLNGGNPLVGDYHWSTKFRGTYTHTYRADGDYTGVRTGCGAGNGSTVYRIHGIVLER